MENLDIPVLKLAFDVVQTVVLAVVTVYMWVINKHKVNSSKIEELEVKLNSEIADTKTRLTAIETRLDHMPDREQISRIHQRIDEMNKNVYELQGMMKGIGDNNAVLLQTIIKQGDKK